MIFDFPKWWAFLSYDGFNYHVNFIEVLEFLQSIGSRLGSRRLGQSLSINNMINSRRISTSLWHDSSWRWRGGRFVVISPSGISSWSSLYPYKTFLPNSVHIPLFMSTFILITVCLFLTGSRNLIHLLIQERHHIFRTTRAIIMMPCLIFVNIWHKWN